MRFDLSDDEWAVIQPHLPKAGRGPKRVNDRRVLNGIFYILRTGAPWRDLPDRYGPHTTVYNRYARWARRGIAVATVGTVRTALGVIGAGQPLDFQIHQSFGGKTDHVTQEV